MKRISIIDSHTGGEPTRVVLSGIAAEELETYRRAIICEPRGHEVIVGALLVEPKDASCAAGVIFFNNVGLLGMCGHGMIGLIATLKHLGRIHAGEHRVETPVGVVTAVLDESGRVSIRNVTSYRQAKGVKAGEVTGDVAWGGNWFFLVADHGLDLTLKNVPQLTQASLAMREAVRAAGYPEVDHVELFGPPQDAANHSRNFVSDVVEENHTRGTTRVFRLHEQSTDDHLMPTITGEAFITAESTLLLDPADPFRFGIS